jgi:dTDP-4-dehydrorhamnose 3,5-epimerase-like enzyme
VLAQLIRFTPRGDKRGSLVALEDYEVGFPIKRVYHIFHTAPGVTRGLHAHRDLCQVAVAVTGSCTFLLDNGTVRETVRLDDPTVGLAINSMVWREMSDFSPDCVLLVLASHNYDESDYIRDYEQFRREVVGTGAPA